MFRCNNCYRTFKDDSELELFVEVDFLGRTKSFRLSDYHDDLSEVAVFRGCPDCMTDEWLMDLDD